MMHDKEPSLQMWERAAELWVRMLRNPKYDNLGDGPAEPQERLISNFAGAMATMIPSNATEEKLEEFRCELIRRMSDSSVDLYRRQSQHVDYGPDGFLHDCAKAVGLKMEFPWKTNVWVNSECISVRNGYGADSVHHYPLGDGRWLVTTLGGRDISKVIEYVQGGKPEFTIEVTHPTPESDDERL